MEQIDLTLAGETYRIRPDARQEQPASHDEFLFEISAETEQAIDTLIARFGALQSADRVDDERILVPGYILGDIMRHIVLARADQPV